MNEFVLGQVDSERSVQLLPENTLGTLRNKLAVALLAPPRDVLRSLALSDVAIDLENSPPHTLIIAHHRPAAGDQDLFPFPGVMFQFPFPLPLLCYAFFDFRPRNREFRA